MFSRQDHDLVAALRALLHSSEAYGRVGHVSVSLVSARTASGPQSVQTSRTWRGSRTSLSISRPYPRRTPPTLARRRVRHLLSLKRLRSTEERGPRRIALALTAPCMRRRAGRTGSPLTAEQSPTQASVLLVSACVSSKSLKKFPYAILWITSASSPRPFIPNTTFCIDPTVSAPAG